MIALIPLPWLIGILLAGWVASAAHAAWGMRRRGRRLWLWLAICLVASAIPAVIVSYIEYIRQLRPREGELAGPVRRCPYCGAIITGPGRQVGGRRLCDECGLALSEDEIA